MKNVRRILGAMAVSLLASAPAQAADLLNPLNLDSAAAKRLAGDSAYLALASDPATATLQLRRANPGAVSLAADQISLRLDPNLVLEIRRLDSYRNESGSLVWYGVVFRSTEPEFKLNALNTLLLVRNGAKITGDLHYEGEWYQIRPLKGGGHALVKVDRSQIPPDHAPGVAPPPEVDMPRARVPSRGRTKAANTITVLVNYTAAAAAASGDINGLIDLAQAESNQGYANSGVDAAVQVVRRSQVTYTETGVSLTDVNRYAGTTDGFMDYVHTQRNQYGADVGILLVNNLNDCGRATGIGSNAATAYAVVRRSCATGNFTFAHEIGHLLSARHDPAADSNNSPFPYGHGFVFTGSPSFRTIMAVTNIAIPRVNFWSNPNILFNGVPMGTAATHHNARVLSSTSPTMAGFKTRPNCIPDAGIDDTLSRTNCCSAYAVPGSTYCSNPGDFNTTWESCNHFCGTQPVNGCVISGGVDDTLSRTRCCSGAAVPGSTQCLDPADFGDDWTTCIQICQ